MGVPWSHEAIVPAPPEAVFTWMTDFREDDHARPAFLEGAGIPRENWPKHRATRRILSREGNVVKLEDTWGRSRYRLTVTIDPAARELKLVGMWGYRATWRAEAAPGGTKLVVRGEFGGLLAPLFKRGLLKQMEQDFRGHVADATFELASKMR